MRVLLVPALVCVWLFAAAPAIVAAEVTPTVTEDQQAPITGTLEKNANVRFGPSKNARIVVTLKAGDTVEVFGTSKSAADWYVIRFPKAGQVWVHSKNLQAVDGGLRWKVLQDKTRARNDSTMGAEVVAELNAGDIVEDKGTVNGEWRAVNIPDAICYVSKSLVTLPANAPGVLAERQRKADEAQAIWETSLASYIKYLDMVKADTNAAIGIDWAGLVVQLDTVAANHASAGTRLAARRMRDMIAALVPKVVTVAVQQGRTPPALVPPAPGEITPPAGETPPVAVNNPGTGTKPNTPPVVPVPPMTEPQIRELTPPPPPPSQWQATGILLQDDKYQAKVGTRDLLMDGDGNVLAFIKTKEGVDLKLSEIQGCEVGAKGEIQTVPVEQSGLPTAVKMIIATDVAPLRR